MNITKDLEGKTVYLRPAGNNVSRYNPNEIFKALVVKVARVNITIMKEEYHYEEKFKYGEGNYLDSGYNSGYYIFSGEQELKDRYFVEKLADIISDKFRYSRSYIKLGKEKLIQIANIMEIELPEDK